MTVGMRTYRGNLEGVQCLYLDGENNPFARKKDDQQLMWGVLQFLSAKRIGGLIGLVFFLSLSHKKKTKAKSLS